MPKAVKKKKTTRKLESYIVSIELINRTSGSARRVGPGAINHVPVLASGPKSAITKAKKTLQSLADAGYQLNAYNVTKGTPMRIPSLLDVAQAKLKARK